MSNLPKKGSSLEVEGNSTPVEHPQTARAIEGVPLAGAETVAYGGRAEPMNMYPIIHVHWFSPVSS